MLMAPLALAQTPAGDNELMPEKTLVAWVYGYAEHKDADSVVTAIRSLKNWSGIDEAEIMSFMVGFWGGVFAAHPDKVEGWLAALKDLPYPGPKQLLWSAAQLSRIAGWRDIITRDAKQYDIEARYFVSRMTGMKDEELDLYSQKIDYPMMGDMFWGWYFATGDKQYVQKIISTLALGKDDKEGVVEASCRYLTAYASKYPAVMVICEEELGVQPDPVKARLRKVIEEAKATKSAEEAPGLKALAS
jgi:hypothetical protein